MTTRRGFLASSVAVLGALAGCTRQSGLTTTESVGSDATTLGTTTEPTVAPTTTTADTKTTTTTTATETPTTTTDTETTTTRTTTETDGTSLFDPPKLNRTPYPVAWEWDMPNRALGIDTDPRAALLTTDDWQNVVNDVVLSEESRSLLAETDFDTESVVAFQTRVTARLNRLILHSVDGVGTSTITLTVSEWESGSGQNSAPPHLLLVRVPNQGVEPTEVQVAWIVETAEA